MLGWDEREGRILHALAEAEVRGVRPDSEELLGDTRMDPRQAEFGLVALLDAGMVAGINTTTHDGFHYSDLRLLPDGRRALGEWPGSSKAVEAPLAGMELFISHSSQDADLAAALVGLLRSALSIPADEVRCTSVDGYRLPGGAETGNQLREEIFGAQALIGLLSPASLASSFVLFELGARWGARKHLLPLLARGVVPSAIPGPIADLNALNATNTSQVHQLVSDIGSQLGRKPAAPAVYEGSVAELALLARPQHQGEGESLGAAEVGRRQALLARLRQEYLLGHDGLTPAMLAGTEPIPSDWVERRLEELGEPWRQQAYW